LDRLFGLTSDCEITLEAHPQTVDELKLRNFRSAGVTRLSVGGESLNSTELAQLGRDHDGARVLTVVELARAAGLQSVNVDFMYAIPGQTPASWERTLRTILRARPDHLSLYPLSIEPRTVFARKWRRNSLQVPDDETAAAMYILACCMLRDAGYDHYEISNWAMPGHRCLHNMAYWYNREFFAIGVGAHAYLKPYRTENVGQTRRYIDCVHAGESPVHERVHVNAATRFSETMMLRLRLLGEGVDLNEIRDEFSVDVPRRFADELELLTGGGLVELNRSCLVLAEHAVPVANEVWQCFM
jgi:oxygen-independent coproporphyrinogen-3 oxidase